MQYVLLLPELLAEIAKFLGVDGLVVFVFLSVVSAFFAVDRFLWRGSVWEWLKARQANVLLFVTVCFLVVLAVKVHSLRIDLIVTQEKLVGLERATGFPTPSLEAIGDVEAAVDRGDPTRISETVDRFARVALDDVRVGGLEQEAVFTLFAETEDSTLAPIAGGSLAFPLSIRGSIAGCALRHGFDVYYVRRPDGTATIRAWTESGEALGSYDDASGTFTVPGGTCRFQVLPSGEPKVGVLCSPAGNGFYSPTSKILAVGCLEVTVNGASLCGGNLRLRLRNILLHFPIADLPLEALVASSE